MLKESELFSKKILLSHQYYYPAFQMLADRVTPESRSELLSSLPTGNKNVMLYIHVPFCDSKCAFCGFDKHYNLEEMDGYVARLKEELKFYAQFGYRILNMHFGGGTPTLIPGKQLLEIVNCVKENFDCAPDMNINIEGSCTSIWHEDIIGFIKEAGITRASIGVQSFNPNMREVFKTKATLDEVYLTLDTLNNNNIEVFTDILFGYPDFKFDIPAKDIVMSDLKTAMSYGVAGIDYSHFYPYGNKLSGYIDELGLKYPNTAETIDIMNSGADLMISNGYNQETSYGFVKRGNIIIETSYYGGADEVTDTLAIGSSAFGSLNGFKYRNSMYAGYMRKGLPSYMQVKKLSEREKEQMNVVSFSKLLVLSKNFLKQSKYAEDLERKINHLVEIGMVTDEGEYYKVTRKGWNYVDNIYYYMLDDEERAILEHETKIIIYD